MAKTFSLAARIVLIFINFAQFSSASALVPHYPHYRYPSDLIVPPTTFKPIQYYSHLRGQEFPKDISWKLSRDRQPIWKATYVATPSTTTTTTTTSSTTIPPTTTTTTTLLPPPPPSPVPTQPHHFDVVFPKPSMQSVMIVRVPEASARMVNYFHPTSQPLPIIHMNFPRPQYNGAARVFSPKTNSFSTMLRNSDLLIRHAQQQEQREMEMKMETLERPRSSNVVKKELSLQSLDEFPEESMVSEMEVEAPAPAALAPTPSTSPEVVMVRSEDMMQAFATPEPSVEPVQQQDIPIQHQESQQQQTQEIIPSDKQQELAKQQEEAQQREIPQPAPTIAPAHVPPSSSSQPETRVATTTPSSSEELEDDFMDFKELLNIFAPKLKNGKGDGKVKGSGNGKANEPEIISLDGLLKEAFLLSSLFNDKDSDDDYRDPAPVPAPRPTTGTTRPATITMTAAASSTPTTNPLYDTLQMMNDWQSNDKGQGPPTQPPPLPRPVSSTIPIVSFPEGQDVRPSSPHIRAPQPQLQIKPGDILSQILGEASDDDDEGETKFVIPPYEKPGTKPLQPKPNADKNKPSSTSTLISQFLPLVPNALRSLASFGRPVLAQNPRTGLYYWIDMNTFLSSENNNDDAPVSRGLRARIGEKERFVRIFQK